MKSGHVVHTQSLMTVNDTICKGIFLHPARNAMTETHLRQPAWPLGRLAQFYYNYSRWLLDVTALAKHRDLMPQLLELNRQLPHVAFHSAHRAIALNNLYDIHPHSFAL